MKYLFLIWGGVGFLINLGYVFSLGDPTGHGLIVSIVWIGGMVFFGFGSLLFTGEGGIFISTAEALKRDHGAAGEKAAIALARKKETDQLRKY